MANLCLPSVDDDDEDENIDLLLKHPEDKETIRDEARFSMASSERNKIGNINFSEDGQSEKSRAKEPYFGGAAR